VPDAELAGLYAAPRVCLPSTYEGFGLTPLEALAAGVPSSSPTRRWRARSIADAAIFVPEGDADAGHARAGGDTPAPNEHGRAPPCAAGPRRCCPAIRGIAPPRQRWTPITGPGHDAGSGAMLAIIIVSFNRQNAPTSTSAFLAARASRRLTRSRSSSSTNGVQRWQRRNGARSLASVRLIPPALPTAGFARRTTPAFRATSGDS